MQVKGRQRRRSGSGNKGDAKGEANRRTAAANRFSGRSAHPPSSLCTPLLRRERRGGSENHGAEAARATELRRFYLGKGHGHATADGAARTHRRGGPRLHTRRAAGSGGGHCHGSKGASKRRLPQNYDGGFDPNLKQALLHMPARKSSVWAVVYMGRAGRDICGGDGEEALADGRR